MANCQRCCVTDEMRAQYKRMIANYEKNLEHATDRIESAKEEMAFYQVAARYWRDEIRKLEELCN